MIRWLRLASKKSLDSNYGGLNKAKRMAAVVVRGGHVIGIGTNFKNHAEERALQVAGDVTGATIYVARSNGLVSRPCPQCLEMLREAKIKAMVYVNRDGNVCKEYIEERNTCHRPFSTANKSKAPSTKSSSDSETSPGYLMLTDRLMMAAPTFKLKW